MSSRDVVFEWQGPPQYKQQQQQKKESQNMLAF